MSPNIVVFIISFLALVLLLKIIFRSRKKKPPRHVCAVRKDPTMTISACQVSKTSTEPGHKEPVFEASFFELAKIADSINVKSEIHAGPITDLEPVLFNLKIMAKDGEYYSGYELLQAILSVGLRYGDMNIFHRHENSDGTGELLFSLAQAVKPGTFDINDIGNLSCKGLSMFMETQKGVDGLKKLDIMLDTANQLVDDLGGAIYDDEQNVLSQSTIEKWRLELLKI